MLNEIDLKDGIVTYDSFSWLKDNNQVKSNIDFLTEDLLQISFFENEFVIDVDWYPSGRKRGGFIIMLINNQNWLNPIFKSETRNIFKVYRYIGVCIKVVYKKLN